MPIRFQLGEICSRFFSEPSQEGNTMKTQRGNPPDRDGKLNTDNNKTGLETDQTPWFLF